jgi:hypothetical protein
LKKRTKKLLNALRGGSLDDGRWHISSAAGILTFEGLRRLSFERAKHPGKVFWFFSSEKNCLLSLPSLRTSLKCPNAQT